MVFVPAFFPPHLSIGLIFFHTVTLCDLMIHILQKKNFPFHAASVFFHHKTHESRWPDLIPSHRPSVRQSVCHMLRLTHNHLLSRHQPQRLQRFRHATADIHRGSEAEQTPGSHHGLSVSQYKVKQATIDFNERRDGIC